MVQHTLLLAAAHLCLRHRRGKRGRVKIDAVRQEHLGQKLLTCGKNNEGGCIIDRLIVSMIVTYEFLKQY